MGVGQCGRWGGIGEWGRWGICFRLPRVGRGTLKIRVETQFASADLQYFGECLRDDVDYSTVLGFCTP